MKTKKTWPNSRIMSSVSNKIHCQGGNVKKKSIAV